jgi:C4-dicarboxylate-specific signal transduction histidine kinase
LNAVVARITNALDTSCTQVWVSTGSEARDAWIRVADDGPGMTDAVAKHAFEPYFTTKGDGGLGLGLTVVDAFVRRNRGRIKLDTAPHMGTAITLTLPRYPSSDEA